MHHLSQCNFCCYFLQLPFRHVLPSQIEIINAPYCIYDIFFPLCVHTIHYVWMSLLISESLNKSHFSGPCRPSTKDTFSLSHLQQFLHSQCSIPKLSPCKWILKKNQAPFPTPGMSLSSFMGICTFLHPYHRLKKQNNWICILGKPITVDPRMLLWNIGAVFFIREIVKCKLGVSEFTPATLTVKEKSGANNIREK